MHVVVSEQLSATHRIGCDHTAMIYELYLKSTSVTSGSRNDLVKTRDSNPTAAFDSDLGDCGKALLFDLLVVL